MRKFLVILFLCCFIFKGKSQTIDSIFIYAMDIDAVTNISVTKAALKQQESLICTIKEDNFLKKLSRKLQSLKVVRNFDCKHEPIYRLVCEIYYRDGTRGEFVIGTHNFVMDCKVFDYDKVFFRKKLWNKCIEECTKCPYEDMDWYEGKKHYMK